MGQRHGMHSYSPRQSPPHGLRVTGKQLSACVCLPACVRSYHAVAKYCWPDGGGSPRARLVGTPSGGQCRKPPAGVESCLQGRQPLGVSFPPDAPASSRLQGGSPCAHAARSTDHPVGVCLFRRAQNLTAEGAARQLLFFDENLSARGNQSCATCHGSKVGWTGPDEHINKAGRDEHHAGLFGNRKPPSTAYATQAPTLRLFSGPRHLRSGHFGTGERQARNWARPRDQALGPFLNHSSRQLPDAKALVSKVVARGVSALSRRCGTDGVRRRGARVRQHRARDCRLRGVGRSECLQSKYTRTAGRPNSPPRSASG